jgi:hypothetical protein
LGIDVFGRDPCPMASKPTGRRWKLVQYMVEQSFIAKPIPIEDLFVVGD